MACFIVPAAEAAVVKVIEEKMKKQEPAASSKEPSALLKIPTARKLAWLVRFLTGGSVLLAFEHFWHGEIQPFAPFLTAMATPAGTTEMLHEMAVTGTAMAVTCTLVWWAFCRVADHIVAAHTLEGEEVR